MKSRNVVATIVALVLAAVAVPHGTRAAAPIPLNVGQIGNSIAFFPVFVAEKAGFFAQNGVTLESNTRFSSGALVATALSAGSLDVGASVITDVFNLEKAHRPVQILGALVNAYYIDIVASNAFLQESKTSRSTPLAQKIRALKGKRIGITGPGSGTEALVLFLLKQEHIDPTRDVTLVNVGADQPSVIAAFRAGRIDAVSFAWPLSMEAETQGVGKTYISPAGGDIPAMSGQVQAVFYTRPELLASKREGIEGYIRAIDQAERLIRDDHAKAKEYAKAYLPAADDKTLDAVFAAYNATVPTSARVLQQNYERSLKFHQAVGLITQDYAYKDVVASAFTNTALGRKR